MTLTKYQGLTLSKDLNIDEIRYQIDDYITFCVGNEESLCFLKDKELELFDAVEGFVQRKAKRIRPILLMLSFKGYAAGSNPTVIHAAVALELLHTFALIHDDIIDGTEMRDLNPTLHYAIDRLVAGRKYPAEGKDMAMLVGDLIYNIALSEFQRVKTTDKVKLKCLELLLTTALKTGQGQLLELVDEFQELSSIDEEEIFNIYNLKTASYTFCLPLKLGAMLAGAGKNEQKRLENIGLKLGRAFQILDDINDFATDRETSYNFLSVLLLRDAGKHEKKRIISIFSTRSVGPEDKKWLKSIYCKYGITFHAARYVAELVNKAVDEIKELSLRQEVKNLLIDYIRSIMKLQP